MDQATKLNPFFMWKKLGIIFSFLPLVFVVSCSLTINEKVIVSTIHDGDTFSVDNRTFRLFGVDTPEIRENIGGTWQPTEGLQKFWGDKAAKFAKEKLNNKKINIRKIEIDLYDRIISKWSYGEDFGIAIISAGLAKVDYISTKPGNQYYTDDHLYYEQLLLAQKYAADNNLGFWKNNEIISGIY